MKSQLYDAIIIGGSLAGASCGIGLARQKKKVLILEKDDFPRDKVCGEFLSPGVWKILERLGAAREVARCGSPMDRASIYFPSLSALHFDLPQDTPGFPKGWGISRKRLDAILLSKAKEAGCEILQGVKAERIEKKSGEFRLECLFAGTREKTVYSAKTIVNAAGNLSAFAKPAADSGGGFFGFKAHFKSETSSAAVRLYLFSGGYIGLGSIEDGLTNLCGLCSRKVLSEAKGNPHLILARAARENKAFAGWFEGASQAASWLVCGPVKQGFKKYGPETGFPAGDAFCFLEPFMGQGMTLSMTGGLLAADFIGRGGPRIEDTYSSALRKIYVRRLSWGRLVLLLMHGGRSTGMLLSLARRMPWIWRAAIRSVCRSPAEFHARS